MNLQISQPPHLRKPLLLFAIGFIVYSMLVVAAFYLTTGWLQGAATWRPYLAAIPGVALCGAFLLLFLYLRHNDELVRVITTRSLATACIAGLCALVISISRAQIGGYPELGGAMVLVTMAAAFLVSAAFLSWKHR